MSEPSDALLGSKEPAVRVSFEALNADGSPRVFAGMWRPPSYPTGGIILGERGTYYSVDQVAEAWRRGEFDRPLYAVNPQRKAA